MQSLRDKLLKAGLVSEEAAKKAETEKREKLAKPTTGSSTRGRSTDPEPTEQRAAQPPTSTVHERSRRPQHRAFADPHPPTRLPKLPPLPGTSAAHRNASREQLLLDRKLRERVLATQIPAELGANTFYFVTRKNKLRRLELSEAQAKLLQEGKLAVVERPDPDKIEHALVPPEVALELKALSARAVRFLNVPGAQVGFLSDSEISERAHEADASEEPDAAVATPVAASAPRQSPAEAAEAPTFITVRRSPLAG